MIQIQRPDEGPANLKRLGERQAQRDCAAYDAFPDDYRSGKASFQKREYYSRKEVKALLVKMHNSKCCYCEKKLSFGYLHVEHFRPKYGVRQALDQKIDEPPGYYWLAYRWDNLLLACLDCNSRFKHTFFPLENPAERARSHNDDIARERPLFIDPAGQNPRRHIRFDQESPKGCTSRGRLTIEGLRLGRTDLTEDRLRKIDEVNTRLVILAAAARHPNDADLQAEAKTARSFLETAKRPEEEFSSMVIDYLAGFEV